MNAAAVRKRDRAEARVRRLLQRMDRPCTSSDVKVTKMALFPDPRVGGAVANGFARCHNCGYGWATFDGVDLLPHPFGKAASDEPRLGLLYQERLEQVSLHV